MSNSIPAVGLTGGIGSGKSTAAAVFEALGIPILDLDGVGRDLAVPGSPLLDKLVQAFGADMLRPDGSLDRVRLAEYCFADAIRTRRLNEIMHPRIWDEAGLWLQRQRAPYALIEASVLIESGAAARMDAVVVVLAGLSTRRQRILGRRGVTRAIFDAVVARQCDDEVRAAAADFTIRNEADMASLQRQVQQVHGRLLSRFGAA